MRGSARRVGMLDARLGSRDTRATDGRRRGREPAARVCRRTATGDVSNPGLRLAPPQDASDPDVVAFDKSSAEQHPMGDSAVMALVATEYGPPEKVLAVTDVPAPTPSPNQVQVRVQAAALNPLDLYLITGAMGSQMPVRHPFVVGMDAAGTVAAVGDRVRGYAEGDPVLGFSGFNAGTAAAYTVIADGPFLARRPAGLDAVRAAAIPESGLTATHLLRVVAPRPGQRMLVIGATGGVGMFAVQLAAAAGVEVIATATPDDADYVRGLGAADVIDHTSRDVVVETRARYPDGVDVILDVVNAGPAIVASAGAARAGGRVVSPRSGPTDLGGVTAVYIGQMTPEPGDLDRLAQLAADGSLRVEVGAAYPLDRGHEAVADFASTHIRGKVAITV